jgi:hypothetical protein
MSLDDNIVRENIRRGVSDKRFMILPTAKTSWDLVLRLAFPDVVMKPNKSFSGTFDDCLARMQGRHGHRFYYLTMPFGTLVVDGGLMQIGLEKHCRLFSSINHCDVVWLQSFDPHYCRYPMVSAWRDGTLVRHHAPGLIEKFTSYLQRSFIDQSSFEAVERAHRTVGDPLACEDDPDTFAILAHCRWTSDILALPEWRAVATNLD